MINKVNSSAYIAKSQSKSKHLKANVTNKNAFSINVSLVENIIFDLQNSQKSISKEAIQQRIVLSVLNDFLGEQASSENKFKTLYDKVNETLSKNSEGQNLILEAIKKYKLAD